MFPTIYLLFGNSRMPVSVESENQLKGEISASSARNGWAAPPNTRLAPLSIPAHSRERRPNRINILSSKALAAISELIPKPPAPSSHQPSRPLAVKSPILYTEPSHVFRYENGKNALFAYVLIVRSAEPSSVFVNHHFPMLYGLPGFCFSTARETFPNKLKS